MRTREEILGKPELQGEAGQDIHAEPPVAGFEVQHHRLEVGDFVLARPQRRHPRQGDLVRFLVVGRACGWPHLAHVLPTGIGAAHERIFGFYLSRQGEETLGEGKGAIDDSLLDPMVVDLEETHIDGGDPQQVGSTQESTIRAYCRVLK